MLEYPDEMERAERLRQLIGIEDSIAIQVQGFDPVYAIANEDLPRTTDEKTASVHFLRFEFSDQMISAAKAGAQLSVHSGHPNYRHDVDQLPEDVARSLLRDFD